MSARALLDLRFQQVEVKDGKNEFEIDTGPEGLVQVELDLALPDEVESCRSALIPLQCGQGGKFEDDNPVVLAVPGPHRLLLTVRLKRDESLPARQPRDFQFEHSFDVPNKPSCKCTDVVAFSRLKFKLKLPNTKESPHFLLYATAVNMFDREYEQEIDLGGSPEGNILDLGILPRGTYAIHGSASADGLGWMLRKDITLAAAEETIDLNLKEKVGELEVKADTDDEGWSESDQLLVLKLDRSKSKGGRDEITYPFRLGDSARAKGIPQGNWNYEISGKGFVAATGSISVKGIQGSKLNVKLRRNATALLKFTGLNWVASLRWSFLSADGKLLEPTGPEGISGKVVRAGDSGGVFLFAIPEGATQVSLMLPGYKPLTVTISADIGKFQEKSVEFVRAK